MKSLKECNILVVDDNESNIDLLVETLSYDYDVSVAMDGETALDTVAKCQPDLILLDIMMPGMDGYEVCRRLKSDSKYQDIPIIFLTAMGEVGDEEKGLALGAVDYMIKPFHPELVVARVKNQLLLKLQHDELARQNEILIENARLKEDIESITRHDLKTPLNGILTFPALVLMKAELSEKHKSMLEKTILLGKKMLNMIDMSLDIYKMEQGTYQLQPFPVDIVSILNSIFEENRTRIKINQVAVHCYMNNRIMSDSDTFKVLGEELLFYSMLGNLIKNAIEASEPNDEIRIKLYQNESKQIEIYNSKAVPESIRETFFDKFVTAGKSNGTGLGTYSAQLITKTLRGTIQMQSSETDGTTITMSFPK